MRSPKNWILPFKRNGSLVLCFDEKDLPGLEVLRERAEANGVPDVRIVSGEEIHELEPNLSPEVTAVLDAPTGGIVCPFKMTIAFAENAFENGVEFHFNTEAENIEKTADGYRITTSAGIYETRCIVNAAGVYADRFNNMVSGRKLHITPRKGSISFWIKRREIFVSHNDFSSSPQSWARESSSRLPCMATCLPGLPRKTLPTRKR
mgnify:CR=1 FL=1